MTPLIICCCYFKLCMTLCDPMDCSLSGSSVRRIFLGQITGVHCHFLLQRLFPTHCSNPHLQVSCIADVFSTAESPVKPPLIVVPMKTVSPASLQNVPREVIQLSILWTERDFSSHVLAFEPIGFGLPFLCSTCCLRCLRYSSGFPSGSEVKNPPAMQKRLGYGFNSWVGKIPWKRKWQPIPEFLLGKFQGQRSLAGYSPWGHKESDTTKRTCTCRY